MLEAAMPLIDLTHPLRPGQPGYPSNPRLGFRTRAAIGREGYNLTEVALHTHEGTHLDAMSHFVEGGRTVERLPLDWLCGPARAVRLPRTSGECIGAEDLEAVAGDLSADGRLLLWTGWDVHYGTERFFENPPSLTLEAARWLVGRRVRLLGLDLPTLGYEVVALHRILLEREVVVVESLAKLGTLPRSAVFAAFPLPLAGLDGSPVRAVAWTEEGETPGAGAHALEVGAGQ